MWLVLTTAHAESEHGFGSATLTNGTPEFSNCLSTTDCSERFFQFLTESMMEQGFTMQDSGAVGSTLLNHQDGWYAGGLLHTFPFGPPAQNLSGKEENTQFSPVLPKILGGKAWTAGDRRWSIGGTVLPPIPVGGAAALIAGIDASTTRSLGDGLWSMEVDFTFLHATAPVSASKEQLDDAESEGYANNVKEETFEENCEADIGCIDVFEEANLSLRTGFGWRVGEKWIPYTKIGLTVVNERFTVEYDQTEWSILAVQPSVHGGTGLALSETILLALGTTLGTKQNNQSTNGFGVFYRFEGSAAVRF
mgnify:CR=1 FL=1